uniref:LAGLIDADG endonuclease domain-containing protein n=1 Tax=Schizosaccharomyces osmophilus TaxID=2545709 RepID=UPI00237B59A8
TQKFIKPLEWVNPLKDKNNFVESLLSFSLVLLNSKKNKSSSYLEKGETLVKKDQQLVNINYLKSYLVGVIDGSGQFQVNNYQYSHLQYRLVIQLPNNSSNYSVLILIRKILGGKIFTKKKDIIWVVNELNSVKEILVIFEKYPLLTSRKICQLDFLKKCINNSNPLMYFISARNNKYNDQLKITKSNEQKWSLIKNDEEQSSHFRAWLRGYTETKGCYQWSQSKFYIEEKYDKYLLDLIKQYFNVTNKVKNLSSNRYSLEIHNKITLEKIKEYYENNPLLVVKA